MEETAINAKTIIQLDGDVIFRVPVVTENGEVMEIDERMIELHQANVAMAMENWQTVINTLIDAVTSLRKPAG